MYCTKVCCTRKATEEQQDELFRLLLTPIVFFFGFSIASWMGQVASGAFGAVMEQLLLLTKSEWKGLQTMAYVVDDMSPIECAVALLREM